MLGPMYKEVEDCFPEADLIRKKAQEMSDANRGFFKTLFDTQDTPKTIHYELAELDLYTELMETTSLRLFSFLVAAGEVNPSTTDLRFFLKKH